MSILSAGGRNSDQKKMLDLTLSPRPTFSEVGQLPNVFHFWNGDEYTGQFAALNDKQKIAMQGLGIYKTSDGQTYEGIWENDCLKDQCKITFPDKSIFSGSLDEMTIQGYGKYQFKEKVEIEGEFVANNLIGKVYLKDPNKQIWAGKVENNAASVDFYPLHPFGQSVLNLPSKVFQLFYGTAAEENETIWEESY